MNEKHLFTTDEKIKWWGYGEWAEEPDFLQFIHNAIECKIVRMVARDGPNGEHMAGGHLCGYIAVPSDHPYYQKIYEEIDLDVHGGLTFGECSDRHWIGFDCAHSMDYSPSLEHLFKTVPSLIECKKRSQERWKSMGLDYSPIFNKTYKNVNFCIQECKSMADQLNAMNTPKLTT